MIPGHVLSDHDYSRRVNPNGLEDSKGTSSLPPKTSTYSTTAGRLTEAELNERARAFSSPLVDGPWRNFDAYTVKYHYGDPEVDAMYRHTQETSRLLRDAGASVVRSDIETRRTESGERPWRSISAFAGSEAAA
jgi:hypothetical protein